MRVCASDVIRSASCTGASTVTVVTGVDVIKLANVARYRPCVWARLFIPLESATRWFSLYWLIVRILPPFHLSKLISSMIREIIGCVRSVHSPIPTCRLNVVRLSIFNNIRPIGWGRGRYI